MSYRIVKYNPKKSYKRTNKRQYNNRRNMALNKRTGGFRGMEKKFLDREIAAVGLNVNWTIQDDVNDSLNGMKTGTGESDRIGRVIHIYSLHFQYFFDSLFQKQEVNPLTQLRMRIIVFIDKQCNGAIPVVGDVLELTNASTYLALKNLQFATRFQFLYDRNHTLGRSGMNEGVVDSFASGHVTSNVFSFKKYWKTGLKVTFDGVDEAITSITDKAIHVMAVANTGDCDLTWQSRIRYTG